MRFRIVSALIVTFAASLTFAAATDAEGYRAYFCYGAISLIMTISLAMPFVCEKRQLPFWAAYSTTALYALVMRGRDSDPFTTGLLIALRSALGDPASFDDRPIATFTAYALQTWMPLLMGALAGGSFAMLYRLSLRSKEVG